MPRPLLAACLAVALLAAGSGVGRAQPAAAAPPWERWFAALNAGDVVGVMALMRSDAEEGGVVAPHCAGGCLGMDAIEAGITAMVADGYRGAIDPASVRVLDTVVTFDVVELVSAPPGYAVSHWAMEMDGDLIAPACEGICLRSPDARAARHTTIAPASPVPAAPPAAVAIAPTPQSAKRATSPTQDAGGGAGRTPAGWLLVGIAAGLLAMAASALADARRRV